MPGFFSRLGAETAARRRRLRKALAEPRASLIEFALLAGVVLGVASPAFGPKGFAGDLYGPLLPLAAILGYLLIERARQNRLAAGETEDGLAPAFDRRVVLYFGALAAIGYVTFIWANFAPPPFELVPEEVPAGALPVTIGP
jgi:hypothetical protein